MSGLFAVHCSAARTATGEGAVRAETGGRYRAEAEGEGKAAP